MTSLDSSVSGMSRGPVSRIFSLGVWAWLMIVEKESDKLSERGQVALKLLREDLERLAKDD